ncbi:hypothetical protein D3C72_498710 [compost metagenome]
MVPGADAVSTWSSSGRAAGESRKPWPVAAPNHSNARLLANSTSPFVRASTHSAMGAVWIRVRLNSSLSAMSRCAFCAGSITRRVYQRW